MAQHDLGFRYRFFSGSRPDGLTLLLLHGTGGNEDDLPDLGRALAPGAALLSPRGKVLEQGRPRFFRRIAEGVFDLEDLRFRAGELAEFARVAAEVYGFSAGKVVAVGYSNGANIAGAMLLLHPGVLAGAVLLRAMVPLEPQTPPDLAGVPVLLAAGRFDPMAPPAEAERWEAMLTAYGADVTLHQEEAGHGLMPGDMAASKAWLERYFGR